MLKYGSDKPDLRNPLIISDVSHHFTASGFGLFEKIVGSGGVVRAIPRPNTAEKSRKFFDEMNDWARAEGHAGLGYVTRKGGEFGGPIAKNHGAEGMEKLYAELGLGENDGLFFAAGKAEQAAKLAGPRAPRGAQLGLIDEGRTTCAGSSISRSTNGTKTPRRSNSATTRSRCRRAGWRR
jgi:aspartyl-tRNA synthetase